MIKEGIGSVVVQESNRVLKELCALWSSVQLGLHEQDQVCLLRKRMRKRPLMRLRRSSNACMHVGPIIRYRNSGRSA